MIRKIVVVTAAYLGRSVIKRAVSSAVKRVLFSRNKAEEKSQERNK